jgi:hypothetical protein
VLERVGIDQYHKSLILSIKKKCVLCVECFVLPVFGNSEAISKILFFFEKVLILQILSTYPFFLTMFLNHIQYPILLVVPLLDRCWYFLIPHAQVR